MSAMRSDGALMVCSPTGSGKTFAVLLPVIAKLSKLLERSCEPSERRPAVLLVAPNPTLAAQLNADLQSLFTPLDPAVVLPAEGVRLDEYPRGGRLSTIVAFEEKTLGSQVLDLCGENAPLFLISTPESLKILIASANLSKDLKPQPPRHKINKPSAADLAVSYLTQAATECSLNRDIEELFNGIRFVIVDEADSVLSPLSKYAGAEERKRAFRHPTPVAIILEAIKMIRGPLLFQLICLSATLNTRMRQLVGARRWGRGPFNPVRSVQSTDPLQLPAGLRHRFHIYDSYSVLLPNPFTPSGTSHAALGSKNVPEALRADVQAQLCAFSQAWRILGTGVESAMLIAPEGRVQQYARGIQVLANTTLPIADLRPVRQAAQAEGRRLRPTDQTWLPRANMIVLDSPESVAYAIANRIYRKRVAAASIASLRGEKEESAPVDRPSAGDEPPEIAESQPELPESRMGSQRSPTDPVDLYIVDWQNAQGLDLTGLSHVFLSEPPDDVQNYVHLAGRTGRGRFSTGTVVTIVPRQDRRHLYQLYRLVQNSQPAPEDLLTYTELQELRSNFRQERLDRQRRARKDNDKDLLRILEKEEELRGEQEHRLKMVEDRLVEEIADDDPEEDEALFLGEDEEVDEGSAESSAKLSKKMRRDQKLAMLSEKRRQKRLQKDRQLLDSLGPEVRRVREVSHEHSARRLRQPAFWIAQPLDPNDRERLDMHTIPKEKLEAAVLRREMFSKK